jgi:glycosyltransferase involved in cell wall biosynthesis
VAKILFIAYSFQKGGAARSANRIADEVAQEHEVVMLATRFKEARGTKIKRILGVLLLLIERFFLIFLPRQYPGEKLNIDLLSHLSQHDVEKENCDIIFLHWHQNCALSLKQIRKIKKPIWFYCHDEWLLSGVAHYQIEGGSFIRRYLEQRFSTRFAQTLKDVNCEIVYTPSNYLAEKISKCYGVKSQVWRPKIKKDIFCYRPSTTEFKKVRLLFGVADSAMAHVKGLDTIAETILLLDQQKIDLDISCFGGTPPRSLRNRCNYLGYIRNDYLLAEKMAQHDIFLCPSRYEAFGQVAAEALMCGCYLIGSKGTGLEDIISKPEFGTLINPGHAEELALAIVDAARDATLFDKETKILRADLAAMLFYKHNRTPVKLLRQI